MIVAGALTVIAAMFLPYITFGGQTYNWWEYLLNVDIAYFTASILATLLALVALLTPHRVVLRLAEIAAGVLFGLTFVPITVALDDPGGYKASIWIVGAAGAVALAGAVLDATAKVPNEFR